MQLEQIKKPYNTNGSLTALSHHLSLAILTCPSQCLQHQVHQLLIHILVDINLWGKENSVSI